jgi:hypothetical protein|tara:strand:+ start:20902 stop:21303 length:402 start_codon:yes stop_codon:yes gene_type:complete
MTIGFVTALRNSRADAIDTAVNAGSGAGKVRLYDGTQPATGGTATTLLAELVMSDPAFGAASSGVLTASAITKDSSANATGTCTWFRVVDSDDNAVFDGDAGTSGTALVMPTVSIVAAAEVSISSMVLTEGNA